MRLRLRRIVAGIVQIAARRSLRIDDERASVRRTPKTRVTREVVGEPPRFARRIGDEEDLIRRLTGRFLRVDEQTAAIGQPGDARRPSATAASAARVSVPAATSTRTTCPLMVGDVRPVAAIVLPSGDHAIPNERKRRAAACARPARAAFAPSALATTTALLRVVGMSADERELRAIGREARPACRRPRGSTRAPPPSTATL